MPERKPEDVVDHSIEHRFELVLEQQDVAAACYRLDEFGEVVLTHTEVPDRYAGQRIGSILARGVFNMAQADPCKLVLKSPLMAGWFSKHPEYADVVAQ
jgi:uncharacterized protein